MKKALGVLLIFLALCCAVVMSAKRVPKEEFTTTSATTVTATTETTSKIAEIRTTTATETILTEKTIKYTTTTKNAIQSEYERYTPSQFRRDGIIEYGGWRFTWYSEKVLPGKGLKIPNRYSDGDFVRDGDGYIVLASVDVPYGVVIDTPFGEGKVYDTGSFESGTIDVYVSW